MKSTDVERFKDVVKYFLSGWHIRPKVNFILDITLNYSILGC